jgi:hypothetical protein
MKKFARPLFAFVLAVLPFSAMAETIETTTFDALPELSVPDLTARITDKVFKVQMPNGRLFRMEFHANGYVFINVGASNGSRKWRIEGSSLCLEGKNENFCNAARFDGTSLIVKSSSGKIVRYLEE